MPQALELLGRAEGSDRAVLVAIRCVVLALPPASASLWSKIEPSVAWGRTRAKHGVATERRGRSFSVSRRAACWLRNCNCRGRMFLLLLQYYYLNAFGFVLLYL